LDVEFTTRTNDAESDLTTVGDQDLFEHAVWWQGLRLAASPAATYQVAELPGRKPSQLVSLLPLTP
jgi:hypothetical protein